MDNKKAWIALGIICIIWGTTYLFLKIGVHEMAPFQFSGIRQITAGILLYVGLKIFLRLEKPSLENVLKQSAAGILMITLGNGLVAYGEVSIPSNLAAVICASMPVWVSLINLVTPGAIKLTWIGYLSILLGVCSILWLFSDSITNLTDMKYLWGTFLTLLATFGWIGGSYIIKRGSGNANPFLNTAIQMFSGGLGLLLVSLTIGEEHTFNLSSSGWFAMIYLIVFGSIIAMMSYSYALKHLPLPIVSAYAYINPVVAIVLGWIVLNEKMSLNILGACILIILSVVLLNLPVSKRKTFSE